MPNETEDVQREDVKRAARSVIAEYEEMLRLLEAYDKNVLVKVGVPRRIDTGKVADTSTVGLLVEGHNEEGGLLLVPRPQIPNLDI